MTTWPELLATALVGTDRRSPGAADPAGALLDQAAVWSVLRLAGAPACRGLAAPEPAPAETAPLAGAAAAARLASLIEPLDGPAGYIGEVGAAMVAEWLRVAAARRRRVPPELLPALLEAGRRWRGLLPLIAEAGGARAAWLAAENPDWSHLISAGGQGLDVVAAWHEGTNDQRAEYLTAARRDDPAGARRLLAEDWPHLPRDERARLISALATGLSCEDEEFLEQALDDRRREVRGVAADLLRTLPGSAYNERMTRRARACLCATPSGALVVAPPVTCDDGMRRDGILPKPHSGRGERAWWLEQLLARAPLATWISAGETVRPSSVAAPPPATPADFLALSIADGWARVVYRGLAEAAATQCDSAWATALLDVLEPHVPPAATGEIGMLVKRLYSALDADEAVRRTVAVLGDDVAMLRRLTERLLAACPAPWPADLADAVLRAFPTLAQQGRVPYLLDDVFRLAAFRLPAERAADVERMAESFRAEFPGHRAVHALDVLASTLHLRHQMIQEIA